jgi:hypothetical protein
VIETERDGLSGELSFDISMEIGGVDFRGSPLLRAGVRPSGLVLELLAGVDLGVPVEPVLRRLVGVLAVGEG